VRWFFGRVFDNPDKVFDESILRPEQQDLDAFADGVLYITEAQQQVAQHYLNDGSVEEACPPLRVLLRIMAEGSFEGKTERAPEIRRMFTREALLASDWYNQRLQARQVCDLALWSRHVEYLQKFIADSHNTGVAAQLNLAARRELAQQELARVKSPDYLKALRGMIGAEPRLA
jgi:hypothetical protein